MFEKIFLFRVLFLWSCVAAIAFGENSTAEAAHTGLSSQQNQVAEKYPEPSKSEYNTFVKELKTLFGPLYKDKSAAGKIALANELLNQAKETTDNEIVQYSCLKQVLELSVETGEVRTITDSLDLMTELFDVDEADTKLEVLKSYSKSTRPDADLIRLIGYCQKVADQRTMDDEYQQASNITRKLLVAAKRGNSKFTVERLELSLVELKTYTREFNSLKKVFKVLETDPSNSEANESVGKFYCLTKGEFKKGLRFLSHAKGQLGDLARDELNSKGGDEASLANRWWDYGVEVEAKKCLAHAVKLYEPNLEQLKGLDRKKAEVRIESLKVQSNPELRSLEGRAFNVKWENGHATWQNSRFDFSSGVNIATVSGKERRLPFIVRDDQIYMANETSAFYYQAHLEGKKVIFGKHLKSTERQVDNAIGVEINR